jgi:hypothetical protein
MEYILELLSAYEERKEVDCCLHIYATEDGCVCDKRSMSMILFEFDNIEELIEKLLD